MIGGRKTAAFSPSEQQRKFAVSLFSGGKNGFLMDRFRPVEAFIFQDDALATQVNLVGESIGGVKDRSGNNNHALQGTAGNKPTYQTSPDRIDITSADRYLALDEATFSAIFTAADAQFSIVACVDGVSLTGNHLIFTKFGDVTHSENNREYIFGLSGGKIRSGAYMSPATTAYRVSHSTSSITTGKHILTTTYDGSQDGNDGLDRFKFWIDGVSDAATLPFTAGALGDLVGGSAIPALGAAVGAGESVFTADLGADLGPILFIDRILTASEIAQVNNYFGDLWL